MCTNARAAIMHERMRSHHAGMVPGLLHHGIRATLAQQRTDRRTQAPRRSAPRHRRTRTRGCGGGGGGVTAAAAAAAAHVLGAAEGERWQSDGPLPAPPPGWAAPPGAMPTWSPPCAWPARWASIPASAQDALQDKGDVARPWGPCVDAERAPPQSSDTQTREACGRVAAASIWHACAYSMGHTTCCGLEVGISKALGVFARVAPVGASTPCTHTRTLPTPALTPTTTHCARALQQRHQCSEHVHSNKRGPRTQTPTPTGDTHTHAERDTERCGPELAPGHRVSRPRGTGSVGDSVGEGTGGIQRAQ